MKRTQSQDFKFPLYYSKTLIVYNIQYIYAYVRMRARICVCAYTAACSVCVAKCLYVLPWCEWLQRRCVSIVKLSEVSVFLCEYGYLS